MHIKLKPKHWELGAHYCRFVDRKWFPDYKLEAASLEVFIRVESHGKSSCTEEEAKLAAPLFNGKVNRELTLKLLYDEMAEWWSNGNGWYYPIASTLRTEMFQHKLEKRDKVYIRALVKIMRACYSNGFQATLLAFPGMSDEDKARYRAVKQQTCRSLTRIAS